MTKAQKKKIAAVLAERYQPAEVTFPIETTETRPEAPPERLESPCSAIPAAPVAAPAQAPELPPIIGYTAPPVPQPAPEDRRDVIPILGL